MTRLSCCLPLALLVLTLSSSAHADPILFSTTATRSVEYCCSPFATSAQLYWGIYHPEAELNQTVPLFENRLFTEADIGATFAADSASDPDFAHIVSVLTNGIDDNQMNFVLLTPGGQGLVDGALQSDFFTGLNPRLGPDVFGYDVRRITFRIDHLAFLPARDPRTRHRYAARGRARCGSDSPFRAALISSRGSSVNSLPSYFRTSYRSSTMPLL